MERIIFHVDVNSYFATIMQQENPALRGKPIGILKSAGRTCVIAASKEAKKLGIKTGERLREAKVKAPDLITIPAQFDIYLDCTHRLKKVFREFCPKVDIFSLDEAFLELTNCEEIMGEPISYAQKIQSAIKKELGSWVTCNVGISHNKLLAKMAGEIAPKGSVLVIDQSNLDSILSTVEFADVCGVGWALSKKLSFLGVTHPYQINFLDDALLSAHFGPFWSKELRKIGQGKETHFFMHAPKTDYMQSVGRTITGYKLTDDEDVIRRTLLNLLEEATYKIRHMDLAGRHIGVSLWGHERHWGAHKTLKFWVRHTSEIFPLLYEGMYKQWQRDFPIIKFGVFVGGLEPVFPTSLLPEAHKNEKISRASDAINNRFGRFTVYPATLLGQPLIRPEVTGYLGDKTYLGL